MGQISNINWSRWREEAFAIRLRKNGMTCHLYPGSASAAQDWEIECGQMIRWLTKLPNPIAIFATHDVRGRQVLDACLRADIRVPYEATVEASRLRHKRT